MINNLPVPNATPAEQQTITAKVELILAAKAAAAGADASTLEREIDKLVVAWYGPDAAEKKLVGIDYTVARVVYCRGAYGTN